MDVIVGIFDNQSDAEEAVDKLDALGLEPDSIRVMTRAGIERGDGFFSTLARAFSSAGTAVGSALTSFGLDGEEAEFFEEELGDDGVLVAVKASDEHSPGVMVAMRDANGVVKD